MHPLRFGKNSDTSQVISRLNKATVRSSTVMTIMRFDETNMGNALLPMPKDPKTIVYDFWTDTHPIAKNLVLDIPGGIVQLDSQFRVISHKILPQGCYVVYDRQMAFYFLPDSMQVHHDGHVVYRSSAIKTRKYDDV
jgi:hypothetical protein